MANTILGVRGMTDTYNNALEDQLGKNVWDQLASEAKNMSKLEYATVTADIAGIFDPTPVSDGAALVLSAVQGDGLGVLLSLASMIPYAGDALAKPLKIAKYAPKTAKALEQMLKASDNLASLGKDALKQSGLSLEQVAAARKKALEKVQQAMLDAKNKMPGCEPCKLIGAKGEKRQLQMPSGKTHGTWKTADGAQPMDGNGIFEFTDARTLPDGRVVEEIKFKNGAPDFDDYVEGQKYDLWEVNGNAKTDARQLKKMMRESDPNWEPPDEELFVLHHFEDGKVGYVPRILHDKRQSGVPHTGGNSMTNNQLF